MIEYTLIRTKRKTTCIEVRPDGTVLVRGPINLSRRKADAFVGEKEKWIRKAQERQLLKHSLNNADADEGAAGAPVFTPKQICELKERAKEILVPMTAQMARSMGVTYGKITIRAQKTRWGSCSWKGNINYNCLLALLPENVQRYVVVHELCHRKEMNHSKAFWNEVAKHLPSFAEDRKQLRTEGRILMERLG